LDETTAVQIWLDEGIKPETLNIFGVRWDEELSALMIPLGNGNYHFRRFDGNGKKWDFTQRGNSVGIFGRHIPEIIWNINRKNEVIVFESAKSVMKAYGWGFKNCVALMGGGISPWQLIWLGKLGANIVFALDKDMKVGEKYVKALRGFCEKVEFVGGKGLCNGEAPVDKGEEIWRRCYGTRQTDQSG